MSDEFEQWLGELSKTHEVPNAPFVVDAMKAAFAAGQAAERERIKKLWPSEVEISIGHNDNNHKTWGSEYNPQVWSSAIDWLRERLGLE